MGDFPFTMNSVMPSNDIKCGEESRTSLPDVDTTADSFREVRKENGRTYHSFRAGSYPFPNDDAETERLKFQYDIITEVLGRNYFAPFTQDNPPTRVLDIGTGPGQWAIEISDEFPEAEVIGTDLSPIQPNEVPENCYFYVDDSSEEWDFGFDFSYIHTRLTFGCFSDMRTQVIDQALRNLKPGGWLECQELDPVIACDDGTMPADYSPKQLTLALEAASRIAKRQFTCAPLIRGWLEEAGFVDVQQKVFKLPVNGWDASSPRASELGKMWFDNLSSGLGAVCTALLHRHANKQVEEIEVSLVDVRRQLRSQNIHAYHSLYVVWGRKPFECEKTSS
ncbi:hypothetical protein PspLS_09121 [Pyricularia sp. CBS 133598]|nr:hypothetical protein PspLS_09121 [Pyricularia sp. CBS 133598]